MVFAMQVVASASKFKKQQDSTRVFRVATNCVSQVVFRCAPVAAVLHDWALAKHCRPTPAVHSYRDEL